MAYSMTPLVDELGQSVQHSTPPPFFSSNSGGQRHSIQDATSSTPSVLIKWMLTVLKEKQRRSMLLRHHNSTTNLSVSVVMRAGHKPYRYATYTTASAETPERWMTASSCNDR